MPESDGRPAGSEAARNEAEKVEVQLLAAERLIFFSDAVVAIAITLLALDLPVPEGLTNADVLHALGDHWPEYAAFLISFAVIGLHWLGHHRLFRYVTGLAGALPRWSMLWLLTIVVTPFATRVLTADGAFEVRFAFYATVQALAGLFFLLMVHEINRHGLLRAAAPPGVLSAGYRRPAVLIAAFTISIPIAFVTHWAYLCWAAIPFVLRGIRIVLDRRAARETG
ncbi:MAG TPA: TMEM175 family protein [Streptosporangiaceae bacterium]|jgi:uncharacterized membrane protein